MADINALLAQGVTPLQIQNPVNQFAQLQALRSAQQEQQLNALKLQEAQTTMGQQEGLRNYLAGATDYTTPEFTAGLTKFGAPGLAVAKGLSEQATAELTRQKTKSELTKSQAELVSTKTAQARQMLEGINPNDPNAPQLYNQWLEAVHQDDVLGPTFDSYGATLASSKARLQAALSQPGGFANLLNESKMGADKFATHIEEQAKNAETAAYHKGELDIRRRQLSLEEQKAAANTSDLSQKEVQKREAAYPKASAAYTGAVSEIDSLINDINNLSQHKGLQKITGAKAGTEVVRAARAFVDQDAANAQAIMDKIKSKGTLRALTDLRNNSPTGGALGNVSDADVRLLTNSFGTLAQTQDTDTFRQSLNDILAQLAASKDRLKNAYDETYSYRPSTATSAKPSETPAAGKTSKGATTSNW